MFDHYKKILHTMVDYLCLIIKLIMLVVITLNLYTLHTELNGNKLVVFIT